MPAAVNTSATAPSAGITDSEILAPMEATYKSTRAAPRVLTWSDGAAERLLMGADPDRPVVAVMNSYA